MLERTPYNLQRVYRLRDDYRAFLEAQPGVAYVSPGLRWGNLCLVAHMNKLSDRFPLEVGGVKVVQELTAAARAERHRAALGGKGQPETRPSDEQIATAARDAAEARYARGEGG